MQEFQEDLYGVLGVADEATADEIRKAYLKLAKKLHPDRFPNDPEKRAEAQAEFSNVTRAHEVLSDPKRKEEYDAVRGLAKVRSGTGGESGSGTATAAAAATTATAEKTEAREGRDQWAVKHKDRALDMLKRKRFPEAETAIKEAIRLNPNNADYHAVLADIHLARGWKSMAQTAIQTALKIDPKNHEAKSVELKLKSQSGKPTGSNKKLDASDAGGAKKGFLDQLKELLNKKM